jgi:hypothetical protein
MDRRDALRIGGSLALTTTLAGCFTGEQNEAASGSDGTDSPATDNETERTDEDALDLSEANVVSVDIDDSDGGTEFTVGLHHDDAGEDGYANWWQVERLDGTQLGRRELRHPHDKQPFERSETIEIPDTVTCVVIRGHDQTHGYGGRAVVVNLESGSQTTIQQGSNRQAVSKTDCT